MKKLIKKYGNSMVIVFSTEELKIIGLKKGDIIDMTINNIETREAESKRRSR